MLSVYRSPTGRVFAFDQAYPEKGSFFYSPDGMTYYHLDNYGSSLGLEGNHVSFQNVGFGIVGSLSYDNTALTVEHDIERFVLDPDASFDLEKIALCARPVMRYIFRMYTLPDGRLLYISYACNGRYNIHYKVYVATEGSKAVGLDTSPQYDRAIGWPHHTEYPTNDQTFIRETHPVTGRYLARWGQTPLIEVRPSDYRIHETPEGEVMITKK